MKDHELDEKIVKFRGKKDENKDDEDDLGKLLEDEEKEEIHVNSSTYAKIISMSGGPLFVVVLILSQLLNESFDAWSQSVRSQWAIQSLKEQQELFGYYMIRIIGIAALGSSFICVKVYLLSKMN